jgi:hypothetical protein
MIARKNGSRGKRSHLAALQDFRLNGPSARNHVDQDDGNGDHEQYMNETAHRVGTDHPKQPKDEQYDENGPKHCLFLS